MNSKLNGLKVKRGSPVSGNFEIDAPPGSDLTGAKIQILGKINQTDLDADAFLNLTTDNGGIVAEVTPTKITAKYNIPGELTAKSPLDRTTIICYELNLTYAGEQYSWVLEEGSFTITPRIKIDVQS